MITLSLKFIQYGAMRQQLQYIVQNMLRKNYQNNNMRQMWVKVQRGKKIHRRK